MKFWQIEESYQLVRTISDGNSPILCLCLVKCDQNKYDALLITGSEEGVIRVYLSSMDFSLIQKIIQPVSSIISLDVLDKGNRCILALELDTQS